MIYFLHISFPWGWSWSLSPVQCHEPQSIVHQAVSWGLLVIWKRSVIILIPKKGNAKECSNYCTIALISQASKVMLKFSKSGFSNTWTVSFQMFKLVLEKTEEPEIKLPTSIGSLKKQESSRKTSTSALLTMLKPLTVWITTNCVSFRESWTQTHIDPRSLPPWLEVRIFYSPLITWLYSLCCCQVTSVVSDSVWPHRRQPTRLPRPWDSPGKNTGVGCHFLLQCMKVKSDMHKGQLIN